MSTVFSLLEAKSRECSNLPAILAPERSPLSYGALFDQLVSISGGIRKLGIAIDDRVAIVLPNGPEMAVAFLAVAACAIAAPLNPAYRREEFEFYLSDLNARALIIQRGSGAFAREAAVALGIRLIEIEWQSDADAGMFSFEQGSDAIEVDFASAQDVALILHTSGTTARPKIVPLTHQNLLCSAGNIGKALLLSPADRCLNVMPLFHIHGLVAALLSSLRSGAGVICTPGFIAPRFFRWFEEEHPTWYTAVPAMHQSILERAAENRVCIERSNPLRFIRSSSAALPPKVMKELETVFNTVVVEAYGMTEAAHQMACNPLPPQTRKPGSVGIPAGPEMTVLDEAGNALGSGMTGEVAIRGLNVTAGYEGNAQANQEAFVQGWFKTGDQGYFDHDGYLFLTGRLKELINRGGEKISPREVEEALLNLPPVAQAVCFAIADATLGEELGAAVVLRPGFQAGENELRASVANTLADFKVPRRIVILEEIPKGPTGKPQRIGLAAKLGVSLLPNPVPPGKTAFVAPRGDMESQIAHVWQEVLQSREIGVHDQFLHLGGDSITGAQILSGIERLTGTELRLLDLFENPTIAALAAEVTRRQAVDDLLAGIEGLTDEEAERELDAE